VSWDDGMTRIGTLCGSSDLSGVQAIAGGPLGAAQGLGESVVLYANRASGGPVEFNGTRMCALLVGLPS
jgi:hypothetical protein